MHRPIRRRWAFFDRLLTVGIHCNHLTKLTTIYVTGFSKAWLAEAEHGSLTADALLTHHCRSVYRQVGTHEGTAERIGLDRRTVKRRTTDNPP
jgi:hypothetical protein